MKKIKSFKNYKDTILETNEVEEIPHKSAKKQIVIIHGGDAYSEYGAYLNHNEYLDKLRKYDIGNAADRYRIKKMADLEKLKILTEEDKLGWIEWLANQLKDDDYEVFMPNMPTPPDAIYAEWKVWFEKLMPHINNETIFIGHSLGGIFLTKYFSENPQTKVKALILIAAPIRFGESGFRGGFILNSKDVSNLGKIKNLYFLQSKDDPCVPYQTIHKYKKFVPGAKFLVFRNKGHFNMTVFPELLNLIEKLG